MNKKVDISDTIFEVKDDKIIYDNKILKTPNGNIVTSKNSRLLDQIVSELDSLDALATSDFSSWSLYSLQKDFFENPNEDMTMAVEDVLLMDSTLRSCAGPESVIQFKKWRTLIDFLDQNNLVHPEYIQSMTVEDTKEWINTLGINYIKNHKKLIELIEYEIENLYNSQKACLLGLSNFSRSFMYSFLIVTNKCSPSEFANAVYAGEAINPKFYIDEVNLDDTREYINKLTLVATTAQNYIKYSDKDEQHEIYNLIVSGESKEIEFKSTLRKSLDDPNIPDLVIEESVLKSICGFINSDGGHLFIGINDQKEFLGLDNDGFKDDDAFLLHLKNIMKDRIVPDVFTETSGGEIISKNGKRFFYIECFKQKSFKPYYIKRKKARKAS